MKIKFRARELKLFWFFLTERHGIYKRRFIEKLPYPWTEDAVLRDYKFTNVYRQLDRVSIEWQNRYARLLMKNKNIKHSDIVFHNAMFRLFNWPETYDTLNFGLRKWNKKQAIKMLLKRQTEEHEQIFTGAYIVTSGGQSVPKVEVICQALDFLHRRKRQIANRIRKHGTMEYAVKLLQVVPTVGAFVAYELACDLRFTKVLAHAKDVLSWANPGPGAKRGIHRLMTGKKDKVAGVDYVAAMRMLLTTMPAEVKAAIKHPEWPIEMREIEHSLCEFDKMMRVRNGEGKPRSRYRPPVERVPMPYGDDE